MNALQLHERLLATQDEQHRKLDEADEREKALPDMRKKASEWVYEHEEVAIKELRTACKERVFTINGMRDMLRRTKVVAE